VRNFDVIKREIYRLSSEAYGRGKDTITLVLSENEFKECGHTINFKPEWTRIHGDEVYVHIKI